MQYLSEHNIFIFLIQEGESVYVLGTAKKRGERCISYKEEPNRRLEELKNDAEKMKGS